MGTGKYMFNSNKDYYNMCNFESRYSKFERQLPDVSGKVFAITGTTSGTGFAAAKTVAKHNGEVILLNRPSSRSVASLEKLQVLVPDGKFIAIDCDLKDFGSVQKACETIKKNYSSLYCLSNNAGIMATPDEITKDGFDKQMQTNHFSHFLLTKELFPLLVASVKDCGDARVVQHSSAARDFTPNKVLEEKYFSKYESDGMLGGDQKAFMTGPTWYRYFQSKLANSVFTQALQDKIAASNDPDSQKVLSLCAHPGGSNTNLADHLTYGYFVDMCFKFLMNNIAQSSEDGSMGLLKAMMDTTENVKAGILYGPRGMTGYPVALPPKEHESNAESKEMLWRTSEKAIGATFDI